ncbi:hypothetical protein RB595_010719 [Gaeumannomyces hyphopodioides]
MAAPAEVRTETNGPIGIGIAVSFLVATVFFSSLRFYTRAKILKAIGKDDWAVLIATVFAVAYSIAVCFEVKYGMGRHVDNVTEAEMVEQMKFLMFAIYAYNLGMHSVKLGFLLQYRRIFQSKAIQTICFWLIIYICFWGVLQAALSSFTCIPVAVIYPSIAGTCVNTLVIWYLTAGMSMATDFAIFCIPLPSVWKLQLPPKQRIIVIGIFSLGFCVCIVSVYRIFTLEGAAGSHDPTWDNIGAAIWTNVELGVSIIVSSLPTLRPLLSRFLPGSGFTSAGHNHSAYICHDGGSTGAAGRYGTRSTLNKPTATTTITATTARSHRVRPQSISTEELALNEVGLAGGGGGVYASASSESDHANGFAPEGKEIAGRIMMTTEIMVNSGTR